MGAMSTFFGLFVLVTCGILVPLPGIEPSSTAVSEWSPNYWAAREFPQICFNMATTTKKKKALDCDPFSPMYSHPKFQKCLP